MIEEMDFTVRWTLNINVKKYNTYRTKTTPSFIKQTLNSNIIFSLYLLPENAEVSHTTFQTGEYDNLNSYMENHAGLPDLTQVSLRYSVNFLFLVIIGVQRSGKAVNHDYLYLHRLIYIECCLMVMKIMLANRTILRHYSVCW